MFFVSDDRAYCYDSDCERQYRVSVTVAKDGTASVVKCKEYLVGVPAGSTMYLLHQLVARYGNTFKATKSAVKADVDKDSDKQ